MMRPVCVVMWLAAWANALQGCTAEPASGTPEVAPSESANACVPGQVDSCACGAGAVGIAICVPTGDSMGPCECQQSPTRVPDGGQESEKEPGATDPQFTGPASVDSGPTTVAPADDPKEPIAPQPPPDERARDIRITEVAIYQAVKIPLVNNGEAVVERNAPVVQGKKALVRAFVQPLPGFTPREVEATLTLRSTEGAVPSVVVRQRISGESKEGELDSTINFDVPSTSITEDVQWSVTLRELDPASASGTINDGARYPEGEDQLEALRPRYVGPLRVMLVPYRYNADGSGRLPDMAEDQIQRYRSFLGTYYPFSELVLDVHEPVDYEKELGPSSGWEGLLDFHCALRESERPDPRVFYYGFVAPTLTSLQYDDGMVGLSFIPGPAANDGRCSVGLGFGGGQSAFIMAHELGHALGLPHAPCDAVGAGPFPYDDAKIGSWGFLHENRTLLAPDKFHDLMSYCSPSFISDYNYQKVFERVRYLNLQFALQLNSGSPQGYLRILQLANGQRTLVGRGHFEEPRGGNEELQEVRLFDEQGGLIESRHHSYFIPMSADGAGTWFIPDMGAHSVEFRGAKSHSAERMRL